MGLLAARCAAARNWDRDVSGKRLCAATDASLCAQHTTETSLISFWLPMRAFGCCLGANLGTLTVWVGVILACFCRHKPSRAAVIMASAHRDGADIPMQIDGEDVLYAAELSQRWLNYRACTCACAPMIGHAPGIAATLFWAPFYLVMGGEARTEEFHSWQLFLTPSSLHYSVKQFGCGLCCQTTVTKVVPLDRIQDIRLVSECCGDCCGWSEGTEVPWQVHVQTSGTSANPEQPNRAEIVVHCMKEPDEFRHRVMAAKRKLLGHGASHAEAKTPPTMASRVTIASGSGAAASATLSRMEGILREGVELLRADAASAPDGI